MSRNHLTTKWQLTRVLVLGPYLSAMSRLMSFFGTTGSRLSNESSSRKKVRPDVRPMHHPSISQKPSPNHFIRAKVVAMKLTIESTAKSTGVGLAKYRN